jgi:hypothetical protein
MTILTDGNPRTTAATITWSRRVRRIGGFIQAGFAAFWLVRGGLALGGTIGSVLAASLFTVAIAASVYGIRATAGKAPRPVGPEASRIERAVTVATVIQLAASFLAPAVAIKTGHADWVLPSIAITIGPLLLWLDYRLALPRYRLTGWMLTLGPLILVAVLTGTALAAATGIGAGALLLATAASGFHDLAGQPTRTSIEA